MLTIKELPTQLQQYITPRELSTGQIFFSKEIPQNLCSGWNLFLSEASELH